MIYLCSFFIKLTKIFSSCTLLRGHDDISLRSNVVRTFHWSVETDDSGDEFKNLNNCENFPIFRCTVVTEITIGSGRRNTIWYSYNLFRKHIVRIMFSVIFKLYAILLNVWEFLSFSDVLEFSCAFSLKSLSTARVVTNFGGFILNFVTLYPTIDILQVSYSKLFY